MDHILSLSASHLASYLTKEKHSEPISSFSNSILHCKHMCFYSAFLPITLSKVHTYPYCFCLPKELTQFPVRLLKYSRPYACICLMYSRKSKTKKHLLNEQEKEKSTNSWNVGVGGQNADHTCLTFHYKGLALRQSEMKTHHMVLSISLTGF